MPIVITFAYVQTNETLSALFAYFLLQAVPLLCLSPSVLSRTWPVGDNLVAIITLEDKIFGRPANFGSEAD